MLANVLQLSMDVASAAWELRTETWVFWLDGAPAASTAPLTSDVPLEPLLARS
jgi:hypothetical protein